MEAVRLFACSPLRAGVICDSGRAKIEKCGQRGQVFAPIWWRSLPTNARYPSGYELRASVIANLHALGANFPCLYLRRTCSAHEKKSSQALSFARFGTVREVYAKMLYVDDVLHMANPKAPEHLLGWTRTVGRRRPRQSRW